MSIPLRLSSCLLFLGGLWALQAAEPLRVRTSIRGELALALKGAFQQRNPDIALDFRSSTAGKIMAELDSAHKNDQLAVDLICHSRITDFIDLAKAGRLEPYRSPEARHSNSTYDEPRGHYTTIRMGELLLVTNTDKRAPLRAWSDLLDPSLKGRIGISDPQVSGTAFMGFVLLQRQFGWAFLKELRENQLRLGANSSKVLDDTAAGTLHACIAPDYLVRDWTRAGAHLAAVSPAESLLIPTCAAIMKGTPHPKAARRFMDFLLSREAQGILAAFGAIPARADLPPGSPQSTQLKERIKMAIRVDFIRFIDEREAFSARLTELFK